MRFVHDGVFLVGINQHRFTEVTLGQDSQKCSFLLVNSQK